MRARRRPKAQRSWWVRNVKYCRNRFLRSRAIGRPPRVHRIIGAVELAGIVIEKLAKIYSRRGSEVHALKGIDLEVRGGEVFGLLGPNGAGKTTTVGVCTTRVYPTSGRVEVDGIDVRKDPARVKLGIGVVTQFNTLDRLCTAWENIYFHCRYFEMTHREAKRRATTLLEQFRLSERQKSFPDELSGGM